MRDRLKDVLRVLTEENMFADPDHAPTRTFETTGDPEAFDRLAARFLGPQMSAVAHDAQ